MRVSRPFVLAALALTLAACGTTSAGAPGAGGSGSGNPSSSSGVVITVADNGRTITLARGKVLVVRLSSQGMLTWDRPRLAVVGLVPGPLRELSAHGGYPSRAAVVARYLAVRPGTATLSSITDARCLHVTPKCAFAQRGWHVTVIVRGA